MKRFALCAVCAVALLLPIAARTTPQSRLQSKGPKEPTDTQKLTTVNEHAVWSKTTGDLFMMNEQTFNSGGLQQLTQAQYFRLLWWAVNSWGASQIEPDYSADTAALKQVRAQVIQGTKDFPDTILSAIRSRLRSIPDVQINDDHPDVSLEFMCLESQLQNDRTWDTS